MTNAGGLRNDLPEGTVTNGDVLDALPFVNLVDVSRDKRLTKSERF